LGPGGEPLPVTIREKQRCRYASTAKAALEVQFGAIPEPFASQLEELDKPRLHCGPSEPPVSWQPDVTVSTRDSSRHSASMCQWHPVCGVCGAPVKETPK
ncbi:MAG: hypothetical protein Q8S13_08820, partial [Dehalococcoidia bacterium]|nr:hypothetical protein [Dehalococcoidia bacterium]